MRKPTVLIIDDEKNLVSSLMFSLEEEEMTVFAAYDGKSGLAEIEKQTPDVVLLDLKLPDQSGFEVLDQVQALPAPPVTIMISAHGDIPMAVQAVQDGAYSFLEKPYEPRRLLTVLQNAAERARMRQSNARLTERHYQLSGLDRIVLGQSAEVQALRQDILALADIDAAVLLNGETGTGKDLAARALHDLGPAPDAPFLALNCAGLSAETFETDMFGTWGARDGRLLAAAGGTLFLDEICACPLPVQAKLLRVIENKEILPIGAPAPIGVTFRILSSTNEDADQAVRDGRLRSDLFYRLNTVVLDLPPLRQRQDDLALLARHFLDQAARVYGISAPDLSQQDLAALLSHDWPGNVRELRHVCERRCLAARRGNGTMTEAIRADLSLENVPVTLREAVATFERELIAKAIRDHAGRMDETAEALGIGRRTLNEKIVKLALDKDALL